MMANLVTNSEQKGVIATKIAKVNEEVSLSVMYRKYIFTQNTCSCCTRWLPVRVYTMNSSCEKVV